MTPIVVTPIVVAGGGPAGATAATLLARAGRSVTLLERTCGPTHKICGEFVSGEALVVLARTGLDVGALGGHPIGAVRLIRGTRTATAPLPFPALGISRARLDEALLRHARASGVELHRGCTILRADPGPGGVTLTLAGGAQCEARTLLLATGKHELRGLRRAASAEDMVGFKMHFALPSAALRELSGHVEVTLFADAYVGLQRIEDRRANLCLLVSRDALDRSGGTWQTLLERLMRDNRQLGARLAGAEPLLERPLSIFRVPYGFVHAPDPDERSVYRLGDQAAVIPSFSGDGMAIALHSAALAAKLLLRGDDAHAYHRQLRRDVAGQIRRAWALYRLGTRPGGQAALMAAAALWPRALGIAASLTRVPPRAVEGAVA